MHTYLCFSLCKLTVKLWNIFSVKLSFIAVSLWVSTRTVWNFLTWLMSLFIIIKSSCMGQKIRLPSGRQNSFYYAYYNPMIKETFKDGMILFKLTNSKQFLQTTQVWHSQCNNQNSSHCRRFQSLECTQSSYNHAFILESVILRVSLSGCDILTTEHNFIIISD